MPKALYHRDCLKGKAMEIISTFHEVASTPERAFSVTDGLTASRTHVVPQALHRTNAGPGVAQTNRPKSGHSSGQSRVTGPTEQPRGFGAVGRRVLCHLPGPVSSCCRRFGT